LIAPHLLSTLRGREGQHVQCGPCLASRDGSSGPWLRRVFCPQPSLKRRRLSPNVLLCVNLARVSIPAGCSGAAYSQSERSKTDGSGCASSPGRGRPIFVQNSFVRPKDRSVICFVFFFSLVVLLFFFFLFFLRLHRIASFLALVCQTFWPTCARQPSQSMFLSPFDRSRLSPPPARFLARGAVGPGLGSAWNGRVRRRLFDLGHSTPQRRVPSHGRRGRHALPHTHSPTAQASVSLFGWRGGAAGDGGGGRQAGRRAGRGRELVFFLDRARALFPRRPPPPPPSLGSCVRVRLRLLLLARTSPAPS
jgi:hypothetical protein